MIQTKNLSFHYDKEDNLFNDLTFNQVEGNIIGLLGKNGAGKSTLLNLFAGLLNPKKGTIRVNGFNPYKRDPQFLTNVFLVNDVPFFPALSIANYTKVFSPFYKNFDSEKMNYILEEFEIKWTDKLHKISHGQQKKFMIAFALATNCKLLLLDEPTNGLDIPSKSVFRKVLVSSIEADQLVVISTHQVKDVETIIDRIVILEEGKIVFEKDIVNISEKLQFKKLTSVSSVPHLIYQEKCPEGYNVILPVADNEETNIDIELLFNAITNHTQITL